MKKVFFQKCDKKGKKEIETMRGRSKTRTSFGIISFIFYPKRDSRVIGARVQNKRPHSPQLNRP
jgi:hypothetical protein